MLKPSILAATTLLILLGNATSIRAENPNHLRQLLNTGRCQGCDLSDVNLSRENLSNADLAGANLQGANLSNANLSDVDLTNANLQNANLNNTNLTGALLQNANLRGTILDRARHGSNQRNQPGWGRQTGQQTSGRLHQGDQRWGRKNRDRNRSNSSSVYIWSNDPNRQVSIGDRQPSMADQNIQNYAMAIRNIYEEVTAQPPNRQQLREYVRDLVEGRATLAQIRRDIVRSPEAISALNALYQRLLGRDIDPSGRQTWTAYMMRGNSLADVYREVSRSPEAQARR